MKVWAFLTKPRIDLVTLFLIFIVIDIIDRWLPWV